MYELPLGHRSVHAMNLVRSGSGPRLTLRQPQLVKSCETIAVATQSQPMNPYYDRSKPHHRPDGFQNQHSGFFQKPGRRAALAMERRAQGFTTAAPVAHTTSSARPGVLAADPDGRRVARTRGGVATGRAGAACGGLQRAGNRVQRQCRAWAGDRLHLAS